MTPWRTLGALIGWLGAPAIWAAHFVALYASESLFCSRGAAHSYVTFASLATLVALGAIGLLAFDTLRRRSLSSDGGAFMSWVAGALSIISAGGVAATTLSAIMIRACADGRLAALELV